MHTTKSGSENVEEGRMVHGGKFPDTHWSLISRVGSDQSAAAERALEELCRLYWFPVYAFVRGRVRNSADAEDLTQGFFLDLLKRSGFEQFDQSRGKFRSYLLGAVKNYLGKTREKERAQKRGGGRKIISIDQELAEFRLKLELHDHATPDRLYDRAWASTVLQNVLRQLGHEYSQSGKEEVFKVLQQFLSPDQEQPAYSKAAKLLGLSEGAARAAVFRLRKRYRKLLREDVLQSVATPEEVDAEIEDLMAAFGATNRC